MIIDTHCHLDFPEFDRDRAEVLGRAKGAGVGCIINVGSSLDGSREAVRLAEEYHSVYATLGIHPHYAEEAGGKVPDELKALLKRDKVVAIGEVGLDYYRNLSPKGMQKGLFEDFIDLALSNNLPIIIHTREAHKDTLDILKARNPQLKAGLRGVVHCFSGDQGQLGEYLKMGLYVSFTCNLTFKKADNLRGLAASVPVERLLLETDAPFLAPQAFRGKRNEPAHLVYLVKELASVSGLSEADIARITTHNAKSLFGLPIDEKRKIAYPIRDSLYLNITGRCTNDCSFCTRRLGDFVKGHNLRLDKEPTVEEILDAAGDISGYREVVFCGYGEPTLRLDAAKEVARALKKRGARVRMVTNGEGDLIHNRSIAGELRGLIDKVSVSLNVDTERKYDEVCRSGFGKGVFARIKDFAKECRDAGIEVELTFLNLPGVDERRCERIAKDELRVGFRMRRLNAVG